MTDLQVDARSSRQTLLFVIDTVTVNVFFFVVNLTNEVLIGGMSLSASLRVRMIAILTNTLTARPYTLWRDWLARTAGVTDRHLVASYFLDTFAFFSFQLPLYWINMAIAGDITWHQMATVSLTIGAMAGLLGRPCGLFVNAMRKVVGL